MQKIIILIISITFTAIAYANAESPVSSRFYLMEGVYYLINEKNSEMAEEFFRKTIASCSFDTLSDKSEDYDRKIAGEAFYFLGKIHYERAASAFGDDVSNNIAWSKKYLREAEGYGINYDKLHPPLLDDINKKYPGIKLGRDAQPTKNYKTKAIFEVGNNSYRIDTVKIDRNSDIKKVELSTKNVFSLEEGARYKMKIGVQEGQWTAYKTLVAVGITLVFLIARS